MLSCWSRGAVSAPFIASNKVRAMPDLTLLLDSLLQVLNGVTLFLPMLSAYVNVISIVAVILWQTRESPDIASRRPRPAAGVTRAPR